MEDWPAAQVVIMAGFVSALCAAAITDTWRYVIPNAIVLALVGLFGLSVPFAVGPVSWASHLGGAAIVFAIGYLLFRFRLMGGGDVKLWAACGLWVGLDLLPSYLLHVTVAGGMLSVLLLVLRAALARSLAAFQPLYEARPLPRVLRTGEAVPYGVAIAAGSILLAPEIACRLA